VKPTTATVYGHTRRNLVEYFGADKPLHDITSGDADEWRLGLINKENLAENKLRVPSPKTEHHTGGESRMIPIFPELRPYLEEVFDAAQPKQQYLITRYRSKNANLRTQLLRIIKNAAVDPWPKLFQNLRSTRETELAEEYPLHVVCAWIGNTQAVAAKHYL